MRSIGYVILAGAGFLAAGTLNAAATYSYITDRSSYDLSQGQNMVQVYLLETGTPTQIGGDVGGLTGVGFNVARTSGSSAKFVSADYNVLFGSDTRAIAFRADGSLDLSENTSIDSVLGVGFDTSTTQVYLGSITLSADTGTGLTQMTISDLDPLFSGDITNAKGMSLDNPSPGSALFSVVVPEPVGLGLVVGGCLLLMRRQRTSAADSAGR